MQYFIKTTTGTNHFYLFPIISRVSDLFFRTIYSSYGLLNFTSRQNKNLLFISVNNEENLVEMHKKLRQ